MKANPKLISNKPLKMFTLEQAATRPNSLTILTKPSLMATTLHYPDGRKEKKNGL
jgi:hypothetical protein